LVKDALVHDGATKPHETNTCEFVAEWNDISISSGILVANTTLKA
jgi:hypothetical protein